MSTHAADVIIVGGGFMGAATAFFLRKRGVSVILLERGLIGSRPVAPTSVTCAAKADISSSYRCRTVRTKFGAGSRN